MRSPLRFTLPLLAARGVCRRVGLAALLLGTGLVGTACDSTARIFLDFVLFNDLQVVGATPVKSLTNSAGQTVWEPACGGDATAVRIDFNLVSSEREADGDGNVDRDRQIRPFDNINKRRVDIGKTLAVDTFALDGKCLTEHSGEDAPGACSTAKPSTTIQPDAGLQFVDHLHGEGRGTPIGVALLVDQSGSTSGLVEGTTPPGAFKPTCLEGKEGAFDLPPGDLDICASDKSDYRVIEAKALLKSLNASDRAIVFQFNEVQDVKVVCSPPGVSSPTEAFKEANCFTSSRSFVLGDIADGGSNLSALDGPEGLKGKGTGRSNLWRAVDKVFNYMKDPARDMIARHIVIIADGPDTCAADSVDFQHCFKNDGAQEPAQAQSPCANAVAFETLRTKIEAYIAEKRTNQDENDIHVSFLHFQAPGYPEYDARMQQLACLTGGQYVFINNNKLTAADRGKVFDEAMNKLRFTLGGHWGLVAGIGELTADPTQSTAAADKGQSYSLEGQMTLLGSTQTFTQVDESVSFGFTGSSDHRLPILRPCETNADCGTNAGTTPCGFRCDPATKLCNMPAQGSPCGSDSICCAGACTVGEVCEDPADPKSCP